MIPGKNQEQYIILGAHMDGYFHAYQDDALGVGINMAIAKAMIESGYKSEHTIIFIAHGSEEYGISACHYDWCIGSWYATHKLHPDWTGKAIAFINIDAIRPGTPKYVINSTPELHGFFKEYMMEMIPPQQCWKEGVILEGLNGPWSDDYNYAISGIPGIICGRGPSEWGEMNYHTQFDDYTAYNSEIVKYTIENYVNMVLSFDSMAIIPLNFKYIMDSLQDTLDTKMVQVVGESIDELKKRIQEFALNADWYYRQIKEANHVFQRIKASEDLGSNVCDIKMNEFVKMLQVQNKSLLYIYRLIQKDLMKLDQWDCVVHSHEPINLTI